MSNLGNIVRKEIKELLTPAALIPLVIFAIIFGSMGSAIGGAKSSVSQPPVVGVVNQDRSELSNYTYERLNLYCKIVYNGTNTTEGINAVDHSNGVALIVIENGFQANITTNRSGTVQSYWIMRGTGILNSIPSAAMEGVSQQVSRDLSMYLLDNHITTNSTVILSPIKEAQITVFKGREMVGINPSQIASVMSGQGFVIPLIVVMVIIYAGSMVVTSMGSEKENKTLETLLTLPVGRSSIVFGKLAGAAVVGMIMAGIYMIGLGYYMNSLTSTSSLNLASFGISLNAFDYVLVGISLFLALIFALALCMILGIFTRNYKAAQTMTLPVTMLALISMFVLMFTDFNTLPIIGQVLVFAIPFSQPIIAINSLMFGNYGIVFAGIVYEVAISLVTMFIAVYLFKKDILLTGRVKSAEKKGGSRWIHYPGMKK
jgi:ABC-2 type transport system permease protein